MPRTRDEIRAYYREQYAVQKLDPEWKAKRYAQGKVAKQKRMADPEKRKLANTRYNERKQCKRERAARLIVQPRFAEGDNMPLRPTAPALLEDAAVDAVFREHSAKRVIEAELRQARRKL